MDGFFHPGDSLPGPRWRQAAPNGAFQGWPGLAEGRSSHLKDIMAHSPATTAAWNALLLAAKADQTDQTYARRLWERAEILAHTLPAPSSAPMAPRSSPVRGTNGNTLRSGQVIPFGRSKGQAIEECDEKDLQWVAGAMRESIADPAKEKWAPKNRILLDAIEAELATR